MHSVFLLAATIAAAAKEKTMATTAALTENSRQGINSEKPPCVGLEARLSPILQLGCGHAYDETPVGLVVYVRNDPVNLVDPDGRKPKKFTISVTVEEEAGPPEDWVLYLYGDLLYAEPSGFNPLELPGHGSDSNPGNGGGAEPEQTPQTLMRRENLTPSLIGRIGQEITLLDGSKQKPCELFLNALLAAAGIKVGISAFIESTSTNVKYKEDQSGLLRTGRGYTDPSTWTGYIYPAAFQSSRQSRVAGASGDYLSTTIHEGFHVISHILDGPVLNNYLGIATSSRGFSGSRVVGDTGTFFDRYCGPNPKSFP